MSTIQPIHSIPNVTTPNSLQQPASSFVADVRGFIDWREIPGGTFAPRLEQLRAGATLAQR